MDGTMWQAAADSVTWSGWPAADGGPDGLRVLLAFGFLLVFVVGGLWLTRRAQLARGGRPIPGVRVLSRSSVGRRSDVMLVEVDRRRVLIGVTPTAISALSEWEADEPEVPLDEARTPVDRRFDSVLDRVVTKLGTLDEVRS